MAAERRMRFGGNCAIHMEQLLSTGSVSQTEAIAWYLKIVRTLEIKHIPVLFRVWVRLRRTSCWTWSHVSSQQFARLLNLLNPFLKRQTITPSLYNKFFLTSFPCKISSIVHFIRIPPLEGVRWFLVMSQRVLTGIQRGKAGYLFLILFLFLHRQELPRPCSLPFLETKRFLSTWRAILLLHEGILSSHLRAMWYVEMLCFDVTLEEEANWSAARRFGSCYATRPRPPRFFHSYAFHCTIYMSHFVLLT